MLSPLFCLRRCDLTRMYLLCEGTFLCVVCLCRSWAPLPGTLRGCRANPDGERVTQVPTEQEVGAAEQDLSSSCSAPHAGAASSHPGLQSCIHARALAGPCFLQGFPGSRSPPSLLAHVWSVPALVRRGLWGLRRGLRPIPAPPDLLVEGQKWCLGCCPPRKPPTERNISASQVPRRTGGEALWDSTLRFP